MLLVNNLPQDKQSLVDMKADFIELTNSEISKIAIHKKFTPEAVEFLKQVLNRLLTLSISTPKALNENDTFSCIQIKDSTKFKLPLCYQDDYPSYGSFNKNGSLMNLQFEYDIISGNWSSIELTKATRNDQADSKETIESIIPSGLYIRDLGYITTSYLRGVQERSAYFINRLPKIGVYTKQQGELLPFDWSKLDREMKKNGETLREVEVYIGKKEKLKCRIIINALPENIKEERIRKASIGGKRSNGYRLSKEYKLKAGYNIFITNVPKDKLAPLNIIEAYSLRWQIELVFRTWKSNLDIHNIKPVKTPRMQCQLIAKLIWIWLTSRLHHYSSILISDKLKDTKACSIFKFLKYATKFFREMLYSITDQTTFINWFNRAIPPLLDDLCIEKRLKKRTHVQILSTISKN